jgi:hypothetical protein
MAAVEENAIRRSEDSFLKTGMKFKLGEMPWSTFMEGFMAYSNGYTNLTDVHLKRILFLSLQGAAFHLACSDFQPTNVVYTPMELKDYAKALGELFEPPAESEQMKLEFENRYQQQGEHPNLYFRDKKNLFDRAYPAAMRDYDYFYNKVISGLINQLMKNGLRLMIPADLTDATTFRNNIMKMATIVRRRFNEGEISAAEALGAEAHLSVNSYQATGLETSISMGRMYKTENINALPGKKGKCYHCQSKDHFIAQCPRKAAGLSATVQSVGEEEEGSINAAYGHSRRNYSGTRRIAYRGKNGTYLPRKEAEDPKATNSSGERRPFQPKAKQFNRRVAVVYEDENGETLIDDAEEATQQPQDEDDGVAAITEGVNSIQLTPEDYSESDYIPGAFLGM